MPRSKGTVTVTPTTIPARFKRLPVVHSVTHLFKPGQAVRLKGRLWPSNNIYLIAANLPPSGESPQYRIRSDTEKFDRMATQANLELISPAAGGEGDALVETSLGLGPEMYLQPSRDRKAEAGNGPIRIGPRVRQAEQAWRTLHSSRAKT
jgi:hypothetical protein